MINETASEDSVRKALEPELGMINDSQLRDKAVKAWTMACRMGGYRRLEDVPTEQFDRLPSTSNLDHQKQTARIVASILKALKEFGVTGIDEDYAITAALCHDVGKPAEWRADQPGIYYHTATSGTFYGRNPAMPPMEDISYQVARHPIWGFHIALSVGMPERVAHAIGMHSVEGNNVRRTPEGTLVMIGDRIWWELVGEPKTTDQAAWREQGRARRIGAPGHLLGQVRERSCSSFTLGT